MTQGLILVTGAAGGQQGRTGRHVAEMLLAREIPVRAFVRRIDERADQLRSLGAEVVEGDFLDYQSIARAVDGASSVYFAYPVEAGLLEATAIMADAARKAGVTRLIDMVMLLSSPDAPTPRMRENYLSEKIFEWAGIGAAHIRATVFHENLRALTAATIARDGSIYLPWGSRSTVIPLVAGEDVARVAVEALLAPSVAPGSVYPLVGEIMTLGDIIATFERVLGRTVRYNDIPDEAWREAVRSMGYNAHAVDHLSHLWQSLRAGQGRYEVTETIGKLTGRPPKAFEQYLREQQDAFKAAAPVPA